MATYTVGPAGDYATMSAAIAAATAGDTLQVLAAYSFDPASEAYQYVHVNKDNLTIESQAGTPSGATIATAPPSPHTRTVINIHVGTTGTALRNITLKSTGAMGAASWVVVNAQTNPVTLEDCVLESPGYGILYPGTGSVFSRCHIKSTGIASNNYGIYTSGSKMTVTIESCLFEAWDKMGIRNGNGGYTIRNCTFYMPSPTQSSVYAMYLAYDDYTVSNCVVYSASGTVAPIIMSDDPSNIVKNCVAFGFANMVFTGLGGSIVQANNVGNATVVTPVFVNLGTDFHPDASGSAYQAGDASLAATTDIDGNSFDRPPSIGCYEAPSSGGGGGLTRTVKAPALGINNPFSLDL